MPPSVPPSDCSRWTTEVAFTMTGHSGRTSPARLSRVDGELSLAIDDPQILDGLATLTSLHGVAKGFADQGVRVRVLHDGVHLITLGAVVGLRSDRATTGSAFIAMAPTGPSRVLPPLAS